MKEEIIQILNSLDLDIFPNADPDDIFQCKQNCHDLLMGNVCIDPELTFKLTKELYDSIVSSDIIIP